MSTGPMRILAMALLLGLLGLAACGKKGSPTPAGPAENVTYPRTYPAK